MTDQLPTNAVMDLWLELAWGRPRRILPRMRLPGTNALVGMEVRCLHLAYEAERHARGDGSLVAQARVCIADGGRCTRTRLSATRFRQLLSNLSHGD